MRWLGVGMKQQEVDARVQAAIENLQAGRAVEDDTGIEFKGDWPDPATKARQLAGAANALRGGLLIYVIGVHDKTGAVTTPTKTEPQEWYARIRKSFDQVAPELLRSQVVYFGDESKAVVALVIDTSQFPYVINVPSENRREVPMRVASGTESAHRNQLVRMFEPSLRAPAMSFAEGGVQVDWKDEPKTVVGEQQEIGRLWSLEVKVRAKILVEHFGIHPTTLPVRDMRLRLTCADFETRPEVRVKHLGDTDFLTFPRMGEAAPPEPVPPQHGVYARDNYVIATAPGDFTATATTDFRNRNAPDQMLSGLRELFIETDEMQIDIAVSVVGVANLIKLSCRLRRSEPFSERMSKHPMGKGDIISGHLGTWEMAGSDSDPWA